MRDRFPLVLVAGVAFLGVLAVWTSRGAARGSFADVLSTWRSEPDGARALYLFAEASGVPVARSKKDLLVLEPDAQLVLLGVDVGEHFLQGLDLDAADAGTDPADALERRRGANAFRAPALGDKERDALLEHVKEGATLVLAPWGARQDALLDALGVTLHRAEPGLGLRSLVPAQPSPWTRGVERAEAHVQAWLELPEAGTPLLVDAQTEEVALARVRWGRGDVLVLGAPELAMNRALGIADNAQLWRALLGEVGQAGPVVFDEYHHGFKSERSLGEFASRYGLQFAALQLVLGVGFWALALRRFGRARQPQEDLRIGATDALFATSRLYREGRHHAHAASCLVREVAQELAGLVGAGARAEAAEVVLALRVHGRTDLAIGLEQLAAKARACASDADVQALAALAATLRQKVHARRAKAPAASNPAAPAPRTPA